MLTIIISTSSLKLGHVGSKTRLLGQIIENPLVHSISRSNFKMGPVGPKLGHWAKLLKILFVHSRGQSFDLKFMKLCQNVNV